MTASVLSSCEEISIQSRREYIDSLWWIMHHSYLPGNKAFALTSYFDDSGSDDLNPMTVLGGPIMSKNAFIDFSGEWDKLLKFYRIPQPLHMKDFVRPYGAHIGMPHEMKLALFAEVVSVINKFKLISFSVSVAQENFDSLLSTEVRRGVIGPYGVAFFFAIMSNQLYSEESLIHPGELISYIVDAGFPYSDQLFKVHSLIIEGRRRNRKSCYVGSMAQDSDERVPALQAADVIAWSARRRELKTLTEEFLPLAKVLGKSPGHTHIPFPKGGIKIFAGPINRWLATGILPSLEDIFRRPKV